PCVYWMETLFNLREPIIRYGLLEKTRPKLKKSKQINNLLGNFIILSLMKHTPLPFIQEIASIFFQTVMLINLVVKRVKSLNQKRSRIYCFPFNNRIWMNNEMPLTKPLKTGEEISNKSTTSAL